MPSRKILIVTIWLLIIGIGAPALASNSADSTNVNIPVALAGAEGGDAVAGALSAAGVDHSGNSANFNKNNNLNGATFGNSAALSASGVIDSGNSSSNAEQGQMQGQLQGQMQGQMQGTRVDSNDSLTIEGDETVYEASRFPVNTAAPVFAGNCSQGASGQWMGGGASIASGNPVCDYVATAGAYIAAGERDEAFKVLKKAERAADWRWGFSLVRNFLTLGIL